MAALGLAELVGPVRFDGFAVGGEERPWRPEPYEPGEVIGGPVPAPWVQLTGVSERQTVNTMSMVLAMCAESEIVDEYGLDVGLTRIFVAGGGRLEPITASASTNEGARPTAVFEDETQWYTDSNGGTLLDRVNRRNVGKSPGGTARVLETTNAHAAGEQSVAERSYEAWLAMAEGRVRGTQRLLYDSREAPPETDMTDEESLLAGLANAYGNSSWVDLERIRDEVWDPGTPPSDSRRFYLNQIAAAVDAWIEPPTWRGLADPTKVVANSDAITIGFDGSRARARGVTDATALIGCRVSDGHLFEIGVWEQPDGPAGRDWTVPAFEVEAALHGAFTRYNVVGCFCDPKMWETYIAEWEAKYARHLRVKASVSQPMHWWMVGGRSTLIVRALEQFHSAVIDGELTHDGSTRLTQHVLNARRRPTRSGVEISKEHPESARKIDAAVAAVLAWQARLQAVAKTRPTFVPRRVR